MCNEVRRAVALGEIRDDFSQLRIPLVFPEGLPNLAPADSVRITDRTAMVRASGEGDAALVMRRWSWRGPGGKPLFNLRGEGRRFANGPTAGRCLVPVDGFYEYGAGKPPKPKFLFTAAGGRPFALAGWWRAGVDRGAEGEGEAFTLLTAEPGPDVAPVHHRSVVVVPREGWAEWLWGEADAAARWVAPAPGGTLGVERLR